MSDQAVVGQYFLDTEQCTAVPKFSTFRAFLDAGFQLNQEDRLTTFRIDFSPWLRAVAEWVDNPVVEWINLIQGSQTSKTTAMMAFLLYVAQKEPTRVLWVQSTEEEAKEFIVGRLKPYIEGYDSEAIAKKNWRIEAFKVFHARVKVGHASNEQTLRQLPAQYVIGDECAVWKHSIALVKKRTRTFAGRRKGIFGTTPPRSRKHHSWQEARAADFYQWWVPCPTCQGLQPLVMSGIKWAPKHGEAWDEVEVAATAHYECRFCKASIYEADKLRLINQGRAVCVDPDHDYCETTDKGNKAKTLQISALYSIFTTWGELAVQFLQAKHAGGEAMKVFITDELAEVPNDGEEGENLKNYDLGRYIDTARTSGFRPGYDLYTAGIDVQRNGELYVVLAGWQRGVIPTGHVLKAEVVAWCGGKFQEKWSELVRFLSPFVTNLAWVALDATDGMVTQDIFDFCNYAGRPYIALKDSTTLHLKTIHKTITPEVNGKKINRQQLVLIANSDRIKDDLAAAFQRPVGEVGSWSFPQDITADFLKAMTLEHRTTDKSGKSSWKPVYAHAPNHYFSALVYASAAMEEFRPFLQTTGTAPKANATASASRVRSQGVNIWQ